MLKIPVHIISGFLGSGKTTAILKLLDQKNQEENWAIVVNEFGKISIDGETFRQKSSFGSVFDISGGCICCTSKIYLKENLCKIIQAGEYDRICIEPTGLGGIEMVTEIVKNLPELVLMPAICMVDICMLGNQRLLKNRIYRDQISRADLIFFSKSDLLSDNNAEVEAIEKFKTEFPDKDYCFSSDKLTISVLNSFSEKTVKERNFKFIKAGLAEMDKSEYIKNYYSFDCERVADTLKLKEFLIQNPHFIRAKGFVNTTSGWILFNYSISQFAFEPCTEKERNELVIIAENNNQMVSTVEDIFL